MDQDPFDVVIFAGRFSLHIWTNQDSIDKSINPTHCLNRETPIILVVYILTLNIRANLLGETMSSRELNVGRERTLLHQFSPERTFLEGLRGLET